MKPAVLCITRSVLPDHIPQKDAHGIYPIDLNQIPEDAYHFINRTVCDSSANLDHEIIGQTLPQILAYCVIKCGDEVLTYSRKKGAEARLHGSRSIGFGGHVDIDDHIISRPITKRIAFTLQEACSRELKEELSLTYTPMVEYFNQIIIDQTNLVGAVHVGLPLIIEIQSKDEVTANPNEISDPIWLNLEQLKQEKDQYENWSKILITYWKVEL